MKIILGIVITSFLIFDLTGIPKNPEWSFYYAFSCFFGYIILSVREYLITNQKFYIPFILGFIYLFVSLLNCGLENANKTGTPLYFLDIILFLSLIFVALKISIKKKIWK